MSWLLLLLKKAGSWTTVGVILFAVAVTNWLVKGIQLENERAEHEMTKQELTVVRSLAETRLTEALAQQKALAACLAREKDAANAASERAAIMKKALPRARAPEEARKVVDDETRAAVAYRLNRAW